MLGIVAKIISIFVAIATIYMVVLAAIFSMVEMMKILFLAMEQTTVFVAVDPSEISSDSLSNETIPIPVSENDVEDDDDDDNDDNDRDDDILYGDSGNDTLTGGEGEDRILGNAGDDTLIGGEDGDFLYGGEGADLFYLQEDIQNTDFIPDFVIDSGLFDLRNFQNIDYISDFDLSEDKIGISDNVSYGDLTITGDRNSLISYEDNQLAIVLGVAPSELSSDNFQDRS